jgi:vancomycin resistance protein YoaR
VLCYYGVMKLFTLVLSLTIVVSAEAKGAAQEVLAAFETTYGNYGRYRGRAHNIRHAVEIVSPATLHPGEQFSFNQKVGIRTHRTGFRLAPVIVNGRMERGYGGGICQVASTIYASALHAGLTIVERHPHSRTGGYIRPGLDATVDWGAKDLILQNPFPFPVTITIATQDGWRRAEEVIRVEITAPQKIYDVQVRVFNRTLSRPNTTILIDPTIEPGHQRTLEPGTPRVYAVVRRALMPVGNGETVRERFETIYPASDRIVLVATEEGSEQNE